MTESSRGGRIVLGHNQYGKAEVRLVRVDRAGYPQTVGDDRHHTIHDLNVSSQLRGDFTAAHTEGDNTGVVPTDTQKNTVFALARSHGITSPETFLLTLADHFTSTHAQVTGGRWRAEQFTWDRITTDAGAHDHAFVRNNRETRTALVHRHGETVHVLAGVAELTVLKSTGSEFGGFPRDRFTSLPDAVDRVLATDVTAWWRYSPATVPDGAEVDFDTVYAGARDLLLARFAEVHSYALQQSVFEMGKAVLEAYPEIVEIRLSCPNNHHFLVDLTPYDLDNPGEVFHAADRPYGLIEATVTREGAADEPEVWASVTGFC